MTTRPQVITGARIDLIADINVVYPGLVVVAQTDVLIFSTVNATLNATLDDEGDSTRLVHLSEFRARAYTRIRRNEMRAGDSRCRRPTTSLPSP